MSDLPVPDNAAGVPPEAVQAAANALLGTVSSASAHAVARRAFAAAADAGYVLGPARPGPDLAAEIGRRFDTYTYDYGRRANHNRVVDLVTDDLRPFVRAAVDAAVRKAADAVMSHLRPTPEPAPGEADL